MANFVDIAWKVALGGRIGRCCIGRRCMQLAPQPHRALAGHKLVGDARLEVLTIREVVLVPARSPSAAAEWVSVEQLSSVWVHGCIWEARRVLDSEWGARCTVQWCRGGRRRPGRAAAAPPHSTPRPSPAQRSSTDRAARHSGAQHAMGAVEAREDTGRYRERQG